MKQSEIRKLFRYVKDIKHYDSTTLGKSVVINNKYEIGSDGTVWYFSDYIGKRGNFPQWVFPLAELYKERGKQK